MHYATVANSKILTKKEQEEILYWRAYNKYLDCKPHLPKKLTFSAWVKNTHYKHWFSEEYTKNLETLETRPQVQNICTIFTDPRDDLLFDVEPEGSNIIVHKCPELDINIEGIQTKALIDSGSEVTCLSEEYYNKYVNIFKNKPTLPITGKIIKGATGVKSTRLIMQVLLQVRIGLINTNLVFIIVPKLVTNCILGYDSQKALSMVIDTDKEEIQLKNENIFEKLRYTSITLNASKYDSMQIRITYDDKCAIAHHKGSHEIKSGYYANNLEYDITYEEVNEKIHNTSTQLSKTQRDELTNLIWKFRKVFYKKPGLMQKYEHHLILKEEKPFFKKPYPIPMNYREKVKAEIEKMLDLKIIRRSTSPFINPMVVVKKKDDSIRLCLDARQLNQYLLADHESPPGIEEIFQKCHGATYISNFDLLASFHQVPLSEDSKKYTAFVADNKVYEYNVVPFGTSTSSAALIRGLDLSIGELQDFIIIFVDDILCISESFEKHLEHLEKLFSKLIENNLTLSFKKSNFVCQEVQFLGHILSASGLKPVSDKIDIIKNYKRPENVKQLQSFLGFVNFYTKFTRNYAQETIPLLSLLKKGIKYEWTAEHQQAFENIKKLFQSNIVLKFADPHKPYILSTDASNYALGAALSQENDEGDEEIISFISRTLKGPELNYFTTEKEMLAIVWALKKFDTYLRGAKSIKVRTDHEALTFLKSCRFANARLRRWNLAMQDYNLQLAFVPGAKNVVADVLSRHQGIQEEADNNEIIVASLLAKKPSAELVRLFKNLSNLQKSDARIKKALSKMPSENYKLDNNLVYKKVPTGNFRIFLPESIINKLVIELHQMYGHIGSKKLYHMISNDFYVYKLKHLVNKTTKTCDTCQKTKYRTSRQDAWIQPIMVKRPHELLSIDFYGPLPTSTGGVKYILTTIDAFSKFTVMYPIKKATTAIVINKLFNDYIKKYGKPKSIISDHGTQFTADKWKTKLEQEQITPIFSSIRHPQSNIVERLHRSLGCFLRAFINKKHTGWAQYIPIIQSIINETHHDTMEVTPIELHLNEKPTRIWTKWIKIENTEETVEQRIYLARRKQEKKLMRRAAKLNNRASHKTFKEGDLVLVKANNVSNIEKNKIAKFFCVYEGPYTVTKIISLDTYLLSNSNGTLRGKFHLDNLKIYYSAEIN